MRTRNLHQRFAAASLLAVWLGMSVSLLAHADGHAHRFCAEHGTIEEGSGMAPHAEGEVEGLALRAQASAAAEVGHEECPLATLPTRDALSQGATPSPAPCTGDLAPQSGRAIAGHAPLALLALAPKASPPAAR